MSVRRSIVWQVGSVLVALFTTAPAHALCGDGVWEEDEQCDDGNSVMNDACNNRCRLSCETINSGLTTHTCGHGANGPFVAEAAQGYPGFVFTDVSAPHTYFTLTMNGNPGENRSAVLYAPGNDWVHAFYLKQNYALSVFSSSGEEVPLVFEHAISCPGAPESLTWMKAYQLSSKDTYRLVFGPTEELTVALAVEQMSATVPFFLDRDGDGYGGEVAGLGACEQADPMVEVRGDCDDDNAAIHPGATTPELCDGVDHDCSGDDDTGTEGLCGNDRAGSACVAAGTVIRCGCVVDADCAGGATCNAAERRCETESGDGGAGGASSNEGGSGEGGDLGTTAGATGKPSGGASGGTAAGGPSSGAAAGGSSGAENACTAATTGGEGGKAGASENGDDSVSDDGCSCRTVGGGTSSASLGLLAAAVLGFLRRRRPAATYEGCTVDAAGKP